MRLSARMLENVAGVNTFNYAQQAEFTQGDAPTIYFQLVDLNQDRPEMGYVPAGRRYVPASGATLTVLLDAIDDSRKITRSATQPYPGDPSIWSVVLLPADDLRGTVNLKLTLTEGMVITNAQVAAALNIACLDNMTRL